MLDEGGANPRRRRMWRFICSGLAAALIAGTAAAETPVLGNGDNYVCVIVRTFICQAEGCTPPGRRAGDMSIILDQKRKIYARCDMGKCDERPYGATVGGVVFRATNSTNSVIFTAYPSSDGTGSFLFNEALSLLGNVINHFGFCTPFSDLR
jgi:hypothetical protein